MTSREIIVTVGGMLIVSVLFTVILWWVGLFNFTGTAASANIVASALALVGVFFTALVTAVGILLKNSLDQRNAVLKDEAEKRQHSLDQRNAVLKDEAEKRLKQEAAIQTVQLLSTNSGKDVPETQRAGVLFILANLGLRDLAITVLDQMLAHDRIDANSAVWVINKALESNDEKIQLEASSILRERYEKFLMKNGQCTFPRCLYPHWNTEMPLLVRQEAAEALLKMITARSCRDWDPGIFHTLILTLRAIWKTESDMRLKNGVGICLEKLIQVYPAGTTMYLPSGEGISVDDLRSELSTLSSDPTSTPSFIFKQLCKSSDKWLNDCKSSEKLQFLLRYAILAPSSHNTQPWKFSVGEDEIQVLVDRTRWLKVADPDQRELYVSVGCALENLLIAAEHFGYGHQVAYFPEPTNEELAATVKFMSHGEPSPFREPALFGAFSSRHTNRKIYEERPIPQSDLQHLQNCCIEEGIWLYMTDDLAIKRKVDELIVRGDATQFSDSAYREELGHWIGKGVFDTPWLMSKMARFAVTYMNMSKGQAKKDSEVLMSAPVLAVLSSEVNDRESQVKVGQVFERLCLAATMLGISVHPMSQILEIPELKVDVGKLIPKSDVFPQHTFWLGYAEQEKGHTPRRPLEEVLV